MGLGRSKLERRNRNGSTVLRHATTMELDRNNFSFRTKFLDDELISTIVANLEGGEHCHKWNGLSGRKAMLLGGIPHPTGAILKTLPIWAQQVADLIVGNGYTDSSPNQVICNSYTDEQGLAQHNDGPLYAPWVSIVSLLSGAKICFHRIVENDAKVESQSKDFSFYLPANSILCFAHDLYTNFTHGKEATRFLFSLSSGLL